MHREGYVLQFQVDGSDSWVGNFQPGVGTFCGIVRNANSILVTVIAGGQAYVVDPASGDLARQFGGDINLCMPVPEVQAILLSNGLWFELIHGETPIWRTNRLSWDGMRNVRIDDGILRGEGWRYDESWHSFEVDIASGRSTGGAYSELPASAGRG